MEATKDLRKKLNSIVSDSADEVVIRGHRYKIRWIRPDVNWKINELVDTDDKKEKAQTIHKVFALGVLNNYFKIKLFYPILWRWFYYVKGYTWDELVPGITLIKKKIPLSAYWQGMALSVEMMTSWRTMEKKEAEQYRQELMLAASRLSEKNTDGL